MPSHTPLWWRIINLIIFVAVIIFTVDYARRVFFFQQPWNPNQPANAPNVNVFNAPPAAQNPIDTDDPDPSNEQPSDEQFATDLAATYAA